MRALLQRKIVKKGGAEPSELEQSVGKALVDLEMSSKELGGELKYLYISSAKEIELKDKRSALVIFVPFKLSAKFKRIQSRLVRELEKKFSGKQVLIIAQRTVLSKAWVRKSKGQPLPRSRTLTAVQASIMDDICYPNQIIGKRTVCKIDGRKFQKIYLAQNKDIEDRLRTFGAVYKALTNKQAEFMFPEA